MQCSQLARSLGDTVGMTRTEAKIQALSWLAGQLRWERTLDELRDGEVATTKVA